MKEKIMELHNQGLSIQQIATSLGCSRATVCYHTNPTAKEKTFARVRLQRSIKSASKALKLAKIEKVKVKKEKKVKEVIVKAPKKDRKRKAIAKEKCKFQTLDQKLSEKKLVQIDSRTWVYRNVAK